MDKKLVPDNFEVPVELELDGLRLRKLTVVDVEKDYEAVMSSLHHLQGTFGPADEWPPPGLTREQNLSDLQRHQREFQERKSFTYTVRDWDETRYLGCVYIQPSDKAAYDSRVILWVIAAEAGKGRDRRIFHCIKKWIEVEWPFKKVAYPGREIAWEKWESLEPRS